jgi:peptidyl-dipeptidase Dcp
MKDKESFWKGLFVAKQWEYGLLDMMLYTQEVPSTIEELDEKVTTYLNTLSIFPHSETYKMYTTFGHIFAWGYSAWYYSYIRAEIIEAQVFAVFKRNGIFDTETASQFLETILWAWCLKDAAIMFKDFVGEPVNKDAYMRRYGLTWD